MGSVKPYYGHDAFTSILRWGILGVVIFLLLGFASLGILTVWVKWPRKRVPMFIDWGAPDHIELPQDHAVRLVSPYDQEDHGFIFDWTEWEGRMAR